VIEAISTSIETIFLQLRRFIRYRVNLIAIEAIYWRLRLFFRDRCDLIEIEIFQLEDELLDAADKVLLDHTLYKKICSIKISLIT
jgi:hypothetical protein